jgi:hypothetical protein
MRAFATRHLIILFLGVVLPFALVAVTALALGGHQDLPQRAVAALALAALAQKPIQAFRTVRPRDSSAEIEVALSNFSHAERGKPTICNTSIAGSTNGGWGSSLL